LGVQTPASEEADSPSSASGQRLRPTWHPVRASGHPGLASEAAWHPARHAGPTLPPSIHAPASEAGHPPNASAQRGIPRGHPPGIQTPASEAAWHAARLPPWQRGRRVDAPACLPAPSVWGTSLPGVAGALL